VCGYSLEIIVKNAEIAKEIKTLLNHFNITARSQSKK